MRNLDYMIAVMTAENEEKKINVELGHTQYEWKIKYGNDGNLWDIAIEDFVDGTIEPDEKMVYWLIGGRLYETDIII